MQLEGHTIVVTGAARGLGAVLARAIATAGARVVIADVLDAEGRETAADLQRGGHVARFVMADIADPRAIEACAADVGRREERVDGLVNCAAIATGIGGKMFDEIDIETWDRVMTVNVRGTWLMTRAFAPLLEQSKRGRIVNVASDTALVGRAPVARLCREQGRRDLDDPLAGA